MFCADALIMDKTWEAPGGFLGFSARFARTGVQMYDGAEIDPGGAHTLADGSRKFEPGTLYPVDRPAEEVFKPSAMASFIAKPLTNDHPAQSVTIDNWSAEAKGVVGEVLRDGEFARLSGLMTDKGLIADFRAGKKQLSGGYDANLEIADGVNDKGEMYVARQTNIDGNHVAFVKLGRAGAQCAVLDAMPHCDAAPTSFLDSLNTQEKPVKTMLIDGLTVDVSNADTAESTIKTLIAARDAASSEVTNLKAQAVTAAATLVTKDAEISKLTADLAAAALTPAQMRDAGKAYAMVSAKAKAAGVAVTDEMDETAIMKAVVDKAMGEKAKDYTADNIATAFAVLTKDVKVDPIRDAVLDGVLGLGDADRAATEARQSMIDELRNPKAAVAA